LFELEEENIYFSKWGAIQYLWEDGYAQYILKTNSNYTLGYDISISDMDTKSYRYKYLPSNHIIIQIVCTNNDKKLYFLQLRY